VNFLKKFKVKWK